jgi:hypothetical protein
MKYYIFSMGYRCSSAGILKHLRVKKESYPFDWIVSRLPVIRHCLETDFRHFISDISANYHSATTHTIHYDESSPQNNMYVCDEPVQYNTYYARFPISRIHTSTPLAMPNDTYAYPLLLNHHNIFSEKDYAYFERCIGRMKTLLDDPRPNKMYLYIHPALTDSEYSGNSSELISELLSFQTFLQTKYPYTYPKGLVFLPVKTTYPYPITDHVPNVIEEIHNTLDKMGEPQCIINVVYMNRDFVDAGEIFMRNAYIETEYIMNYVREMSE